MVEETQETPEAPVVETPVVTPAPVVPVTPATPETSAPTPAPAAVDPAAEQERLNKIAGKARAEGREAAIKDLLKELGVDSKEAAKAALEAQKAAKLAELTEVERIKAELEEMKAKAAQADTAKAETEAKAKAALLKHEIERQAATLEFNDVEDLKSFLKADDITVDLDTQSVSGVAEQAKALAKAKPYLLKPKQPAQPETPVPTPATVPPSPKPPTGQASSEQDKDDARKQHSNWLRSRIG